jgi:cytochrome c oxidase subunit 2
VGTDDTTSMNRTVRDLWVGSWVAALAVGVLVWGLTIWCVVRYRRRKHDTGLPPQLRYNVPLEILYTLVPLFMVGVLFFYTARDQAHIEQRYTDPDVRITVVAHRWAWDFNYTQADVFDTGTQVPEGPNGVDTTGEDTIPHLYLPAGKKVELTLRSRDVDHSFYVPAFSYKKDVIPGRTNYWNLTPTKQGTYIGRCAELCGEFHARMLFKVSVVSPAEYQQHLQALRSAGQTGQLPADLGPNDQNRTIGQSDTPGQQGEGSISDSTKESGGSRG